ncbi:MAG: hypothetical protein V8T12_05000 [Parabacteroides johnsonii]
MREAGRIFDQKKQGDFREVTIFFANKMHWVTAYLEKGEKVTITGDAAYPAMLRVKGGRINDRLSTIKRNGSFVEGTGRPDPSTE